MAKKINSDYFRYDESNHAIQITSRLYDIIINGESYEIQKSLPLQWKVQRLKTQLEQNISDITIIDAIINDSNFQSIISVTGLDATIDTTTTIVSGTNNIELKITSIAGENSINIKINITTVTSGSTEDAPTPDVSDTPLKEEETTEIPTVSLEEDSNPPLLKDTSTTEETKEEQEETTNPAVDGDKQTTDEIGIITYPLTSIEDNTLGEEKKYIYIKPEDE